MQSIPKAPAIAIKPAIGEAKVNTGLSKSPVSSYVPVGISSYSNQSSHNISGLGEFDESKSKIIPSTGYRENI